MEPAVILNKFLLILKTSFMKKMLFILTLLPVISFAQPPKENTDNGNTPVNKYHTKIKNYNLVKDFSNSSPFMFPYFKIRNGKSSVTVTLQNINRMAYDVSATGEIIKTDLPDTNMFAGLAAAYKGAAALPTDNSGSASTPPADSTEAVTRPPIDGISNGNFLRTINSKYSAIQTKYNQLIADLKKLDAFANFAKKAPVIVAGECCSQQKIKDRLGSDGYIKNLDPSVNYSTLSNIINITAYELFTEAKQLAEDIEKLQQQLTTVIKEYKERNCNETITSHGHTYTREITEGNCKIDEKFMKLPDNVEKAVAMAKKAEKGDLDKAVSELNDLLAKVDNEKNFYLVKTFNQPDGDFLKISIKAIPNAQATGRVYADSFAHSIPISGRFKWAIGPSLNFHFGAGLFNETYSIDSARRETFPGSKVYTAMKDSFEITQNPLRQKIIPYIGFMANFYWQTHNTLTPGIAVGLSTSPTQLSDLRAYLGAALIIGNVFKGKLIFNAGFAGAAVDRLKSNLKSGINLKAQIPFTGDKIGTPDQLVEKVFRVGGFFGLSYNLKD